ncbi:MAG: ribonuclease HII [Candidatus Altiarchaeota archaeon]
MKICGIDEAGRGPVVGPMVIAAAVFDKKGREELRKINVRDSKKLSKKKREELEKKIKEIAIEFNLVKIYPQDIDKLRKKFSLNLVEAVHIAELILSLKSKPDRVILDSPDSIEENFREKVKSYITSHYFENGKIPEIISENKADARYIEVSAASILAKVERDREIENLKEKFSIDCGSGYPSDEKTKKFLEKIFSEEKLPCYLRKSWRTITREIEAKKQKKIADF